MGDKAKKALLVVDVQNDFCPDGALGVPEGDRVVPVLNKYIELFRKRGLPVYFTRDWHPPVTVHFKPYGGPWPPHCVQGTKGAGFHPALEIPPEAVVMSKGDDPEQDSYSAFSGHDEKGRGLAEVLKSDGITHFYIGGLATDYCVRQSALDAFREGFEVTVLIDAIRGVDVTPGDSERAIEEIKSKGAKFATLKDIDKE
ncbi:nicotinamidase/pyrazinamidase [Methylophilaceae bacterium]|nr:nicotinamidase/pyrazinamidase [Methylophilaceae bacterium]